MTTLVAGALTLSTGAMGLLQGIGVNTMTKVPNTSPGVVPMDAQGNALDGSNAFVNLTGSGTTTVKSGAGSLASITVNTKGSGSSSIVIYDSLTGSGTKIGTIDSLNLSGQFVYNVGFATGLTLVITGGPDITVSYR